MGWLWKQYMVLTEVEQAFKELKNDLDIRPVYSSWTGMFQSGTKSNRRSARASYSLRGFPQPEHRALPFFLGLIVATRTGLALRNSRRQASYTNDLSG